MNFRRGLAAFVIIATISGCAGKFGGTGMLSDGSPVVGSIDGSMPRGTTILTVNSPDGWSCAGEYRHEDFNDVSVDVPLKCSNGKTGNGIVVLEKFKADYSMAFSLSDGKKGRVNFPMK